MVDGTVGFDTGEGTRCAEGCIGLGWGEIVGRGKEENRKARCPDNGPRPETTG